MDQKLLDYIRHSLSQGISKLDLPQKLLQTGWKKEDIDAAFNQLEQNQSSLTTLPTDNQSQAQDASKPNKKKWLKAGIIVLILIIVSGFMWITNAGNLKKIEESQKILTFAIMGFVFLFASYWIIQIIQVLTGIPILNSGL